MASGRPRSHAERLRPVTRYLGVFLLVAGVAALTFGGCGGGSDEPTLTVVGASSLTEALGKYGDSFAGARVRSSFAGSDQLAAQIRQGAKADVFASADTDYPAELHREGLAGEPVVFARNRLVVVASEAGGVKSLGDLARPGTKVVVGDPNVPVGAYTRTLLARLPAGERRAILANVRSEEPEASSVLAKVAGGAAEAGFVYATDAETVAGEVRTVAIPARMQPDVAYAAAVLGGSGEPRLARRYLQGLLHGAGAADLREAGFLPPR
ncbi:MAG: molybdate ABC transporter substrate-binding protein [Solirubrobacterales bacterium]